MQKKEKKTEKKMLKLRYVLPLILVVIMAILLVVSFVASPTRVHAPVTFTSKTQSALTDQTNVSENTENCVIVVNKGAVNKTLTQRVSVGNTQKEDVVIEKFEVVDLETVRKYLSELKITVDRTSIVSRDILHDTPKLDLALKPDTDTAFLVEYKLKNNSKDCPDVIELHPVFKQ